MCYQGVRCVFASFKVLTLKPNFPPPHICLLLDRCPVPKYLCQLNFQNSVQDALKKQN